MKNRITGAFKEELMRPGRNPFTLRVKAGKFPEISACCEPVGQTAGCMWWIRQPSASDQSAGNEVMLKIGSNERAPSVWTVDCSCLMISGIDPRDDELAVAKFKRTSGGDFAPDDSCEWILSHPRPLLVAFSINQELLENPVMVMATHCFAEAFFDQCGIDTD